MNHADEVRFLAKVDRSSESCWLWTGSVNNKGYGWFRLDGRARLAHRVAYSHWCGEIPGSAFVCHRCDTPPCVNPEHLWLGDNAANINDAVEKGRWEWAKVLAANLELPDDRRRRGEQHGRAKLTASQVVTIRERVAAGANQYRLAEDFGVSQAAIWYAARGRTWKSLH